MSPEEAAALASVDPMRAASMTNGRGGILYAELQFPVTSNYGSMKKRSQRDRVSALEAAGGLTSGNTTATTSVNSGEPSPTNMMASIHDSMDSVHQQQRYVPEYVAVSARKTAV